MKKIDPVLQLEDHDCGLACLVMLFRYYGFNTTLFDLKLKYPVSLKGMSIKTLLRIASEFGFKANAFSINKNELTGLMELNNPLMLYVNGDHFVILKSGSSKGFVVLDPAQGEIKISRDDLERVWNGVIISISPNVDFVADRNPGFISRAWEVLSGMKGVWGIYIFVTIVVITANLAVPWYLSSTIEYLTNEDRDIMRPIYLAGTFIGVMLMMSLINFLKGSVALHIKIAIDRALTEKFVLKLFSLPLKFFNRFPVGDVLSRAGSTSVLREFYSSNAASAIVEICVIIALLSVLILEHIVLASVLLVMIVVIGIHLVYSWKLYGTAVRNEVHAGASAFDMLADYLTGISTIKSALKEDVFFTRWRKRFDQSLNAMKASNKISVRFSSVHVILVVGVPIAVLITGLYLASLGNISQQKAFFCYFLAMWLMPSVHSFFNLVLAYSYLSVHTERLDELNRYLDKVQEKPDRGSDNLKRGEGVCLDNISFSYGAGSQPVLSHVNQTFSGNKLIVITGPSGSGKSTLLKLIAGQLTPDCGEVRCDGKKSQESSLCTYLGQEPYLFRGSVQDNICMFREEESKDIVSAALKANIHEEIMNFRDGYQTVLQMNGSNISGGQKQRIAIARTLMLKPKLLLLDEATSQLDANLEEKLIVELRKIEGIKIIATHRTSWISLSDEVYTISDGGLHKVNGAFEAPESKLEEKVS